MMWDEQDVSISDRAVIFRSLQQFEAFARDPEGYLRGCGALDGIEKFNGIKLTNGMTIQQAVEKLRAENPKSDRLQRIPILCHIDGPVEDFCYYTDCGSIAN